MTDRDDYKRLAEQAEEAASGHDQSGHVSSVGAVLRECASALRAASVKAGEVVAWRYELADGREWSNGKAGCYVNWHWRLSENKPHVPAESIRNLTPLYAVAPTASVWRNAGGAG